jgi:hypothetical protein
VSNYKNKLIKEFLRLMSTDLLDELILLLKNGNYCIELNYETDGEFATAEIPFGYIYNEKYFNSFEQYFNSLEKNSLRLNRPKQLLKKELKNIENIIASYHETPVFNNIIKILIEKYENSEAEFGQWYININLYYESNDRLNVVDLIGFDFEECDLGVDEYFKSMTSNNPEFINIENKNWFNLLDKETKKLIQSGTYYLERLDIQQNNTEIIDFSPLLLNFLKAVEVEFKLHFNTYLKDILCLAKQIEGIYSNESYIKYEIRYLIKFCQNIIRHEETTRINGLSNIYLVFYHFALGKDVDWLEEKSYLNEFQINELNKNSNLIYGIKRFGKSRGEIIHEKIIDTDNEFYDYYNILAGVLKLMAKLKELKH